MALTQTEVSKLYVAIFNRASEGAGMSIGRQTSPDMGFQTCRYLWFGPNQDWIGN